MSYSLNNNSMSEVKITDHHTAESFNHYNFKKGDIVLADAGYASAKNYYEATSKGADVVIRISPNHFKFFQCTYTGSACYFSNQPDFRLMYFDCLGNCLKYYSMYFSLAASQIGV